MASRKERCGVARDSDAVNENLLALLDENHHRLGAAINGLLAFSEGHLSDR
jgi:hypothetical protein